MKFHIPTRIVSKHRQYDDNDGMNLRKLICGACFPTQVRQFRLRTPPSIYYRTPERKRVYMTLSDMTGEDYERYTEIADKILAVLDEYYCDKDAEVIPMQN